MSRDLARRTARILSTLAWTLPAGAAAAQPTILPPGRSHPSALAVLMDPATREALGPAFGAWRDAVEEDGLSVWVAVHPWASPAEVVAAIRDLRGRRPRLEGALLAGEIPVPMLRDAQHLTSAFKMDQERYPRERSSVPTDRPYEDLDLALEPLGRDEANPLLFYYSLRPDSPQRIEKELYSARLFPPEPGEAGRARLRAWFERHAPLRRAARRPLRRAMVVAGHGYNSESLLAWAGEILELREQLPLLFRPGASLELFHHAASRELKESILRALQRPGLQLALFHAHGAPAAQYLLGDPDAATVTAQAEAIRRYLRGQLRQAVERKQAAAAAQLELMGRLDLPLSWFAGAGDPALAAADEAEEAAREIRAGDLAGIVPAASVILLDQCFNGRFLATPSIAQEYLLGRGETAAVVGNTVNILQDIWSDRHLGLLAHGARLGQIHRLRPYLESELLGDPTIRFAPEAGPDLAALLAGEPAEAALDSLLAGPPALRALGLGLLAPRRGEGFAPELLGRLRQDDAVAVRLEALRALAALRGPALDEALPLALLDPHELIRRKAAFLMGDVGRDDFAGPLLGRVAEDPGRRVVFAAVTALQKLSPGAREKALAAWLEGAGTVSPALRERLDRAVRPPSYLEGDLALLADRKGEARKRRNAVRTFRNLRAHHCLDPLLALTANPQEEPGLRREALETLGWFTLSWRRGEILAAAAAVAAGEAAPPEVRAEAEKTRARLLAGPSEPLTP